MRIAYFTNQYPKVSHSFIRREVLALERAGLAIERFALRGWADELADADDVAERERTHYLLRRGLAGLVPAVVQTCAKNPLAFLRALRMALQLSHRSERSWVYHLVYLAEACELLQQCRRARIDHLHVHFGTNPTEVALLARMLGGPSYSFTVHGPDEFDRPQGLHLREKIEGASHVVAISSYGRSQLYRWIAHPQWPKVRVVHCGLDGTFLDAAPTASESTTPRLVCVGRLCEQKGQLLLLEAVRQLRDQGEIFELVLAGDGEMRAELERLIRAHRLESHVRVTGWISSVQVRDELQSAHAMVLPSFAEGLPVVIMEAMALGKAVVSTRIAGIPELVRDGIDGWLVPAGDVDALVATLREVLRAPPERLAQMGVTARARVRERHDIAVEATKLAQIFQEALCRTP